MVFWHKLAGFLVVGYLIMTRSFAYVGLPPLKIFIGEIALGAFLALKPRIVLGTWATALFRPSPLNLLAVAFLLFISYGLWQVVRGVLGGSPVVVILKNFVFNYYSIYLFFGIWVGLNAPRFLPELIRILAWVNGLYGLLYISMLKFLHIFIPGTTVALFGQPVGSAVAIIELMCFQKSLTANLPILAINTVVLLAVHVRAEWLSLCVGLFLWGLLTRRLGRVVAIGLTGLAVI